MTHDYVFYVFAFLFVLSLIGLFGVGLGIMTRRGLMTGLLARIPRGTERRLSIVEHLSLDPHHRLVLVRCDEAEHLLLIGREHGFQIHTRPRHGRGVEAKETCP